MTNSIRKSEAIVTILCPSTGLGLRKDADIVQRALDANQIASKIVYFNFEPTRGGKVRKTIAKVRQKLALLVARAGLLAGYRRSLLSIHLEVVMYKHLFYSPTNVLIPNQEWFRISSEILDNIDSIWCKSRLSESVFSEMGLPVRYIGFQTEATRQSVLPAARKREFFTRIGMTRTRGADQLAEIWSQHPEWPTLNMVVHESIKPALSSANVNVVSPIENGHEYEAFANSFLFHIFVTEAEGFGHSILESMSSGAIVIVTQAAPMTEYADEAGVIFIPAQYAGQLRLSPRFRSTNSQIVDAVQHALALKDDEIDSMRRVAMATNSKLETSFVREIGNLVRSEIERSRA